MPSTRYTVRLPPAMDVAVQEPKRLARVWKHFGKGCASSATVRDRIFSLSTVMRVAGSSGFPRWWPSWWGTSPTSWLP